ncbi:MAG TPA: hypothetical protein P5081_18030 [Phycisphaerae bacterium]|nr:hypothetical protein [Phycisphaerae bacterium]HRW54772.1 hypothetical protein [Phycisphaerae bacterium]
MWDIIVGAFLWAVVVAIYATRIFLWRQTGRWKGPSGHPWSGLTFTVAGTTLLWRGVRGPGITDRTWLDYVVMTTAVCWCVSLLIERRRTREVDSSPGH